jgi:hypothetical protein
MDIRKLAVAMAIGGASLGAGFSLASAQESPSTTTPPSTTSPDSGAPAQPDGDGTAPERDGRNCDKDGDGVPDNQGSDTGASEAGFFQS